MNNIKKLLALLIVTLIFSGCIQNSTQAISSSETMKKMGSSETISVANNEIPANSSSPKSGTLDNSSDSFSNQTGLPIITTELLEKIQSTDESPQKLISKCVKTSETVIYEYPQFEIKNNNDEMLQINDMLEKHALWWMDSYLDATEKNEISLQYQVKTLNKYFISVIYYFSYYTNGMPHPSNVIWTSNIDLDNLEYVTFKNVMNEREVDFSQVLLPQNLISPQITDEESMTFLMEWISNPLPWIIDEPFDMERSGEPLYTYYTNGKIGICVRAPYALGSNAIFEIPNS